MTNAERIALAAQAITRTRRARVSAAVATTGHEAERAYATAAVLALVDAGELLDTAAPHGTMSRHSAVPTAHLIQEVPTA